jgi:hypothetical protein
VKQNRDLLCRIQLVSTKQDANKPASPDALQQAEKFLNFTPMSYLKMGCARDSFSEQSAKLKRG